MIKFLKNSADLLYTFRFLKLLTTPFNRTEAYRRGYIDRNGNRTDKPVIDKSVYNKFHKLVFNIKKIIEAIPGNRSMNRFASALWLVRENYNVDVDRVLKEAGVSRDEILTESNAWFLINEDQLAPGVYRIRNESVLSETGDNAVRKNDRVRVEENSRPVGQIFGVDVYEAVHEKTGHKINVTIGELIK